MYMHMHMYMYVYMYTYMYMYMRGAHVILVPSCGRAIETQHDIKAVDQRSVPCGEQRARAAHYRATAWVRAHTTTTADGVSDAMSCQGRSHA